MKKMGDLMRELGFNSRSTPTAQEAFLKHLIKKAEGVNAQTPTEKKLVQENPTTVIPFPQQMTFDFADEVFENKSKRKNSHKA